MVNLDAFANLKKATSILKNEITSKVKHGKTVNDLESLTIIS